jgi:putative transposase
MPRQPRLILPEVAAHIVQRGNNRGACFRHRSDYLVYLLHLRELANKLGCAVHAYCLMTNHVHLLMTPSTAQACTDLMRDLGQRYVQYFNRRYERTGTLWEGRFRSCIAQSAAYVLACYRYIELNPVRAGMVREPQDYEWSSHAVNVGLREDPFITPHAEFLALSNDACRPFAAYAGCFAEHLAPSLINAIRNATNGGYPLASEELKLRLAASGHNVAPKQAGRPSSDHAAQCAAGEKSGSDPDLFSGGGAS